MVDFGDSDKMIKISGKMDISDAKSLVVIFHSLFIFIIYILYNV